MCKLPYESRRNIQGVADLLAHSLPEIYADLLAGLHRYPLAVLLNIGPIVLDTGAADLVWVQSLIAELHLRSREASNATSSESGA